MWRMQCEWASRIVGSSWTERGRGWHKVLGLSTCWVLAPCREMRKYGREWRTPGEVSQSCFGYSDF